MDSQIKDINNNRKFVKTVLENNHYENLDKKNNDLSANS